MPRYHGWLTKEVEERRKFESLKREHSLILSQKLGLPATHMYEVVPIVENEAAPTVFVIDCM